MISNTTDKYNSIQLIDNSTNDNANIINHSNTEGNYNSNKNYYDNDSKNNTQPSQYNNEKNGQTWFNRDGRKVNYYAKNEEKKLLEEHFEALKKKECIYNNIII